MKKPAILTFCMISVLPAMAMAAAPPALYTAAQATAGAPAYAANCAMCHGADLNGQSGPPLVGQAFAPAANGYTVGAIFSILEAQMPAAAPGSLTHDQYTAIMAYILQKNGYPAGSKALDFTATQSSAVPLVSQVP